MKLEKFCRLKQSLYGLKQSPRTWFDRFTRAVEGYGYLQNQSNHTLFLKHSSNGKMTILIMDVDGIILTGDNFF